MEIRRPLNKSVTLFCALFLVILLAALSVGSYLLSRSALYARYEEQMVNILNYVAAHIDHDDLATCAQTLEKTETYDRLQVFFDDFLDHYGVHYLYVLRPYKEEGRYYVMSIVTGSTTWEKENEPENVLPLGYTTTDEEYGPEVVQKLIDIYSGRNTVFFEEKTGWSTDYTAARPVTTSDGQVYGLLCVDMLVDDVNAVVYRHTAVNVVLITVLGGLFILLFLWWMRANVTGPLGLLEQSVSAFAHQSHGRHDPDELVFEAPEIGTRNEIQALARSVAQMSEDMRDYVKDIVEAEKRVDEMNVIAYEDALTHGGNKAAYDQRVVELNRMILSHQAEFALIMADLNHLKAINDLHGHDKGNEYIIGCYSILEAEGVPLYRVGGDEFVLLLEGRHYRDRENILNRLRQRFRERSADESAPPWQRCSAACGMAVFLPNDDSSVEAVFRRADEAMYEEKVRMKSIRQ